MKVCPRCGEPYGDWIDFCFREGEILRAPTAEELLAAVSEARATTPREAPIRVPGLDPVALALIAQVEAAVTQSVVEVRRSWFRELAARRREAMRRFWARASAIGAVGCLAMALTVMVPLVGGVVWLAGTSGSATRGSAPP